MPLTACPGERPCEEMILRSGSIEGLRIGSLSASESSTSDFNGRADSPLERESQGGSKLFLDAITVMLALNFAKNRKRRYAPMKNLSLVSVDACVAYRSQANVHITVTSVFRWEQIRHAYCGRGSATKKSGGRRRRHGASRVPTPPRVPSMSWEISLQFLPKRDTPALKVAKGMGRLLLGQCFTPPGDGTVWPESLRQLTFGDYSEREDCEMDKVVWPPSLTELSFGYWFNQEIERMVLPDTLEQLYMGLYFSRPVERVTWPSSLRRLEFGHGFNQPIEKVCWPDSLQELTFGVQFNKPIKQVKWPASLERLAFGRRFKQPINNILWPKALKDLQLWAHRVEI